jgi:hypothetical protein
MMNLALNPLHNAWGELEEELSLIKILLGKEIICENLDEEIKLTKERGDATYHGEKIGISVAGDTRWDQQASGCAHTSNSGTSLLCGNLSKQCVGIKCMSKRCAKCNPREAKAKAKAKDGRDFCKVPTKAEVLYYAQMHEPHLCPRNYTGLPKGMEARGAFKIVRRLYNSPASVFVATYVMDDASLTKSILKYWLLAKIENGNMLDDDWPLTEAGVRMRDTGLLPINQPEINFLGDKNHQVRTYAQYYFKLVQMAAEQSQCHFQDAKRLKRAFGYFLHQFSKRSWKCFLCLVRAVLEHHFNLHRYCNDWCPAKKWKKEDRLRNALKYRNKKVNAELYEQFKIHHDKFTSEEALRDMYHQFHSIKCESLNGNITKYVPKHKDYCRTLTNKGRTHTAIGVDLLGYVHYFGHLFDVLGLKQTPITTANHNDLDTTRNTKNKYKNLIVVKQQRAKQKSDKIKAGRTLMTRDNIQGFAYEKGMAGPKTDDPENVDGSQQMPEGGGKGKAKGKTKKPLAKNQSARIAIQ